MGDQYFNGEIRYIDDSDKIVKNIVAIPVSLDGQYHGAIAVYDSLLICWNPRLPDYFFNIFNIDTGEEIGSFVRRGIGPEDAVAVAPINQFFKKGDDLMTMLLAVPEDRLFIWNISQSIERGFTVFDTIVAHNGRSDNGSPFNFVFRKDENVLLAYVQALGIDIEGAETTTPFYEKRTIYTNELITKLPIYTKENVRRNAQEHFPASSFFFSQDVIKPDGSKISQAMTYIPQINIIDINTGGIFGFRKKNGTGFSLFNRQPRIIRAYYIRAQADSNFIYTTYWGKEMWDRGSIPNINTIHVFNWHGSLVYELITDRSFADIWLDQVRNRLYTICLETDEVAYLELNKLNLH
jgi:hypothetical protein